MSQNSRKGFFYVDTINPRTQGGQFFETALNKLHRSVREAGREEFGPGECYALLAAYEELAGVIAEQARTTCYSYSDFFLHGQAAGLIPSHQPYTQPPAHYYPSLELEE